MSECANCGKSFALQGKSYGRKSFLSKVNAIDRSIQEVIETEFKVTLTPGRERFLCSSCCWKINTLAKSADARQKLQESGSGSTYLKRKLTIVSTKVSSPGITPRKVKRQRILSPIKAVSSSGHGVSKKHASHGKALYRTTRKRSTTWSTEADVARALRLINQRQYMRGIKILLKTRVGFKKAVKEILQREIRKEAALYASQKSSAMKGSRTMKEIENFNWETVFNEVMQNCPLLTNALVSSVTTKPSARYLGIASKPKTSVKPVIGVLASIILFLRKPTSLCSFQEMNSLQLWLAGTKREVLTRLNHLGLSVGIKGTRAAIDRIRGQYDNEVLQWRTTTTDYLSGIGASTTTSETIPYVESDATDVDSDVMMDSPMTASPGMSPKLPSTDDTSSSVTENEGKLGYSICFDNVNTKVTVRHQTKDRQNKMFNMVQAYAAKDRIPTLHFSDQPPSPDDILEIPQDVYFPTEMDEVSLRAEMTVIVTRILVKYMTIFKDLQDHVTQHILHRYSKQSASQSTMVPLGVLDKDESKLADAIDILEEYHKYVPLKPNGDPLKIPLHADGLSCERGNDSQCARVNGVTQWQQLQGLIMNVQEWHKRCILLQDAFDELFGSGGRDKGTLFHLKNYFNHRNVSTNVKQSFNHSEEFLDFCGDAYIVLCALHILGVQELSDTPHNFPSETEDKNHMLDNTASKIVDMVFLSSQSVVDRILKNGEAENEASGYCICGMDQPGPMVYCANKHCDKGTWFHLECLDMCDDDVSEIWYCCDDCEFANKKKKTKAVKKKTVAETLCDGKRNYVLMVMWKSLNQKVRRDAIRENDGDRIIMHWKFDMLQFFEKHHPKYFLLGQRLLASVHGSVCPRLQHTLKWNRTVNPHGGKGKNLAMDLQMEYFNKEFKESVKDAAGHLTEATIARHSQMIGVGKALRRVYDTQLSGLSGRTVHKQEHVDREQDLSDFVSLMKNEDLFTQHPGRSFVSFPNYSFSHYHKIDPGKVKARLKKHIKIMARRQQVVNVMQNN